MEFTQHAARSRGLVIGLGAVLLAESVAVHAFLLGRAWWVHALLLVANLSTLGFLLAHDRAVGSRPAVVSDAGIELPHGLLVRVSMPWAAVARVTRPAWNDVPGEASRGFLKISGFDDPNVLLHLNHPVAASLGMGITRAVTTIGLRLDDPEAFVRAVEGHRARGA
jgi:hypothetical protein